MKKKTKARGRSRLRRSTTRVVKIEQIKDKNRRRTKRQKKNTKKEKELRRKLRKKFLKEKQRLEEKKKFLNEISELHRVSRLEITQNNFQIIVDLMQGLQGLQTPLNFDVIEKILTETDKYNKIKEIFESFKFEKKKNLLKNLVNNIKDIDEHFVRDSLELDQLEENIKKFEDNLKKFNTLKNIEELKSHFITQKDLLTKIMEQIGIFYDFVEGMLDNAYMSEEIFNELENFYHDFYKEDYEDSY